jgi:hypothetical protein
MPYFLKHGSSYVKRSLTLKKPFALAIRLMLSKKSSLPRLCSQLGPCSSLVTRTSRSQFQSCEAEAQSGTKPDASRGLSLPVETSAINRATLSRATNPQIFRATPRIHRQPSLGLPGRLAELADIRSGGAAMAI